MGRGEGVCGGGRVCVWGGGGKGRWEEGRCRQGASTERPPTLQLGTAQNEENNKPKDGPTGPMGMD